MMSIEFLTNLFGRCALINLGAIFAFLLFVNASKKRRFHHRTEVENIW